MTSGYVIRRNEYYDSVFLMRIAKTLDNEPGVERSAAVMATEANKKLLAEIGIEGSTLESATANDLVVALIADNKIIVERLLAGLDARLQGFTAAGKPSNYHSIDEASASNPDTNLVVISVPGEYAAREARKALELGKHIFLFSNNVSLEQEVELKQLAKSRGLLLMGPDCGTSIINGVGIGFANVVRHGPIGVVGASGTGLQEFCSLVHQAGSGISHAIGTGSRDLTDAVGGITTFMGLDALEADPNTKVIAIVSKQAQPETLQRLLNRIRVSEKPVIGCFLGMNHPITEIGEHFSQASTIDEAVRLALSKIGVVLTRTSRPESELQQLVIDETSGWRMNQHYLRGLFAGGSFCYQSQQILREAGIAVYSNSPLDKRYLLDNPELSREHTFIDLGDDHFTRGKPHPMIDASERRRRLLAEAAKDEVAVVLLDFILGYISSSDPAGDLVDAIREAQATVAKRGGHLTMVASICGTDQDPQGMSQQKQLLEQAGVIVFSSNAKAAEFCCQLIGGCEGRDYGA